jgi:predicted TIM-barrel fold metal-dependent hydrolase
MVDDGYSEISVKHPMPEVEIDDFRKLVPCKILRVTRLEPLIKTTLDESSKFEEFLDEFQTSLKHVVKKRGAVAFKILIAYRTGLDIQKASETDAKKSFKKYKTAPLKAKLQPGLNIKPLRDYLVWLSVKNSIKLNVPVFFHTGIGDADIVLEKCNPTNMFNFLKDEDVRKATIVLTHTGYPYASEAGWLCSIFPNVYCDISVYTPFTHASMPRRIIEILELAQVSKVLYGSDAFEIPEVHWLSVKIAKKAMSKAFEGLIKFGTLDEDETYKAAKMILSENIKRLLNFSNVHI